MATYIKQHVEVNTHPLAQAHIERALFLFTFFLFASGEILWFGHAPQKEKQPCCAVQARGWRALQRVKGCQEAACQSGQEVLEVWRHALPGALPLCTSGRVTRNEEGEGRTEQDCEGGEAEAGRTKQSCGVAVGASKGGAKVSGRGIGCHYLLGQRFEGGRSGEVDGFSGQLVL